MRFLETGTALELAWCMLIQPNVFQYLPEKIVEDFDLFWRLFGSREHPIVFEL